MSARRKAKAGPTLSGSDAAGGGDSEPLEGLSAVQSRAVTAVAYEPTMARAAEVAGVSVRSLQRWMNEPVFQAAVLRARKEAYTQAVGVSQKFASMAVATFVKVMGDANAPASARVSAGQALMKVAREGIELDDLAARVEGLERKAKGEVSHGVATQPSRPAMRLVKDDAEPEPDQGPGGDRDDRDGVGTEDVT